MALLPTQAPVLASGVLSRRTNWFLVLFSLPFIGIGLQMIWLGLRGMLGVDPGSEQVMQLAAGFIFASMGSLAFWAAVREGSAKQLRAALKARHPSAPWRWRADWDSGRIPCATRATAFGLVFFAVIWNAFCIPMLWAVPSGDAPFVWLFVIVGAALAIAAGLLTWRWFRFGRSVFELTTLPGRLGDRLRGTIHLRGRLAPPSGFRATLSCISYTSGKNGSERILWQEEGTVANEATTVGPLGTAVPVDFPLPADGLPSRVPGEPSGILWRLELFAEIPGIDYATTFEVPVFADGDAAAFEVPLVANGDAEAFAGQTGAEPHTELGPVLRPEAPMTLDRERYTPNSPNRVRWLGARGVELRFPAARNKGYAAIISVMTLVWSFFAALAWYGAPLFFGVIFVSAWFLLIFVSLCSWLRHFRVVADVSGLSVTWRILGIGWTRRIAASAIDRIELQIISGGKRPMYDLKIHRSSGWGITAADGIRSKREAEWLRAALRQGLRAESGCAPG